MQVDNLVNILAALIEALDLPPETVLKLTGTDHYFKLD